MSKPGRPPKAIRISRAEVTALCLACPLKRCVGTGDARCPVRIASRKRWRRDYRARCDRERERIALVEAQRLARNQRERERHREKKEREARRLRYSKPVSARAAYERWLKAQRAAGRGYWPEGGGDHDLH